MFFTSDLHFFHANILKWSNRPFEDVNLMNEHIINVINSRVTKADELYVLGDVSFGSLHNTIELLHRINTRKINLIVGNHDEHFVRKPEFLKCFQTVERMKLLNFNKQHYHLCHYPILSWNKMHHGSVMLHGHSHGSTDNSMVNRIDVGFDPYPNLLHIDEIDQIISLKGEQDVVP